MEPKNKIWVIYSNQGPGGWHILQCLDEDPNKIMVKGGSLLKMFESRYGVGNVKCFVYLIEV